MSVIFFSDLNLCTQNQREVTKEVCVGVGMREFTQRTNPEVVEGRNHQSGRRRDGGTEAREGDAK